MDRFNVNLGEGRSFNPEKTGELVVPALNDHASVGDRSRGDRTFLGGAYDLDCQFFQASRNCAY